MNALELCQELMNIFLNYFCQCSYVIAKYEIKVKPFVVSILERKKEKYLFGTRTKQPKK